MVERMAENALQLAQRALQAIAGHEKVCTERYGIIAENQRLGAEERLRMHIDNQDSFRRLYALIWRLVIGVGGVVIVALFGGFSFLLWYVIQH